MDSPALEFTLLVVDDHARVRQTVMELVGKRFPQCRLLGTDSAEDALALCETERMDVVVLDIKLPGMDGVEAARRIKALWPRTRIVIHSGSDESVFRDASLAAGASAFVAKGSNSRSLVPIIASLAPRAGEPAADG